MKKSLFYSEHHTATVKSPRKHISTRPSQILKRDSKPAAGTLSEVKFTGGQSASVTTYHPADKNHQQLLMQKWILIHSQPILKSIYKTPPIISYRREKSLKGILFGAKL